MVTFSYVPVCPQEMVNTVQYSGNPFERPPWWEATPSGKATWQCKSIHKCIDFYPWREATPLERPLFWCKRGGLTRGVPLYRNVRSVIDLFVCWGLASLFNIWGHIMAMPACGSDTSICCHTGMPCPDMTPHPVTVYRHRVNLSLCYPLMWNVTMEYTTTHFYVLCQTQSRNPSLTFGTHQQMVAVSQKLGRNWTVPSKSWAQDLWRANPLPYPLNHSCFSSLRYITFNLTNLHTMWQQNYCIDQKLMVICVNVWIYTEPNGEEKSFITKSINLDEGQMILDTKWRCDASRVGSNQRVCLHSNVIGCQLHGWFCFNLTIWTSFLVQCAYITNKISCANLGLNFISHYIMLPKTARLHCLRSDLHHSATYISSSVWHNRLICVQFLDITGQKI